MTDRVAERWDEGMCEFERQLAFAMASQEDGAIVNVHEHADEARRVYRSLRSFSGLQEMDPKLVRMGYRIKGWRYFALTRED